MRASRAHWPISPRRPRSWPTSPPHSRANAATTPARTCCSGSRRCAARSRAIGATSISRRTPPPPWRRASPPSKRPRARWRSRWTSASCSTPTASCSRSAIGWPEGALDPSCYDLLASEARLASFVAIAKGDVPARHWFHLGRAVTPIAHGAALISWSGSMFEYLMPSLVMRAPAGSLLEQTSRLIVRRQIGYGAALGLPWGVSESAYNARDLEFTYQYSNFGVPGLGLKRGLGDERRRRALCDGARDHGRSAGGGAQLRAARRHRRARPLRLLRGAGLHAEPAAGGRRASRSCAPSWRTIRA